MPARCATVAQRTTYLSVPDKVRRFAEPLYGHPGFLYHQRIVMRTFLSAHAGQECPAVQYPPGSFGLRTLSERLGDTFYLSVLCVILFVYKKRINMDCVIFNPDKHSL